MKKPTRKIGYIYDYQYDTAKDDLDAGRGILLGIVLGIICWIGIILGIVYIWS